jgi:exopolyphosphatase / guanosine-5'-triphosphate,3'-diphosphate pyrophosphatase
MNFFIRKQNQPVHLYRTAIIDIGSNSVRLVVFSGPRRNPALIFNEKVMAGLGRSLAETGAIDEAAMTRAIHALERFRIVAREMDVDETVCVATAAVRDASNGEEFTRRVTALGLDITILSGEDEARTAGMGVLSAIPEADGIVGDLGGGSLDLARVADGEVHETATLPLGVLRAAAIRRDDASALANKLKSMVDAYPWLSQHRGKPFYLVGGSWRAFARLDMHLKSYPLRVLHQYHIPVSRPDEVLVEFAAMERDAVRRATGLAPSRIETLPDAILLLRLMQRHLDPSEFVVSSFGLREGLLYARMDAEVRERDPLLVATERFGDLQSRFAEDSLPLFEWIAPLFPDDPPQTTAYQAAVPASRSGSPGAMRAALRASSRSSINCVIRSCIWRISHCSSSSFCVEGSKVWLQGVPYCTKPRCFSAASTGVGRAGMPTITEPGATSRVTTAFAPMRAPLPTVNGPRIAAPRLTITSSSMVGCRLPLTPSVGLRPPSVAPW